MLTVTVLGSGTSTGVPMIGCTCEVCTSTNPKNIRTRASIAVQVGDHPPIVIDTTPEFRLQVVREAIRDVEVVFYTHTHADHCHGFDDLRMFYVAHRKTIAVYIPEEFGSDLQRRFHYAFVDTGYPGAVPKVDLRAPPAEFSVYGQRVETLRLPHGGIETAAYRFGNFLYATDFKSFSEQQIERLRGQLDTAVLSGVYWGSHPTHSTIEETIALAQALEVRQTYITHLAHSVDYERDAAKLPPGIDFAFDGLKFAVKQ